MKSKELKEEKNVKQSSLKLFVHESYQVRKETIDLNSGKDRRKLRYILTYESFKLKKRDRINAEEILKQYEKPEHTNKFKHMTYKPYKR